MKPILLVMGFLCVSPQNPPPLQIALSKAAPLIARDPKTWAEIQKGRSPWTTPPTLTDKALGKALKGLRP